MSHAMPRVGDLVTWVNIHRDLIETGYVVSFVESDGHAVCVRTSAWHVGTEAVLPFGGSIRVVGRIDGWTLFVAAWKAIGKRYDRDDLSDSVPR